MVSSAPGARANRQVRRAGVDDATTMRGADHEESDVTLTRLPGRRAALHGARSSTTCRWPWSSVSPKTNSLAQGRPRSAPVPLARSRRQRCLLLVVGGARPHEPGSSPQAASVPSTAQIAHATQVEHLAYHDGLTGLPNRSLFSKLLEQGIQQARRHDRQLAVLFLDLDRFKNINDTLGHEAGDQLLQEVAAALRACVRESDTVARLGGDEFVVAAAGAGRRRLRRHRGAEDARRDRRAVRAAGPGVPRHRQHRHRVSPAGRRRRADADEERRHRDVPGQGGGQEQLPVLLRRR